MKVPIELIESPRSRVDFSDLETIIGSFSKNGQLSAIRLRRHPTKPGKFELIFGSRRLEAAKQLGWSQISADIVDSNDEESFAAMFSENVDRKDFTDYEKALFIRRYHEATGKSYAQISESLGKSKAYIYQHLALLNLLQESPASEDERVSVLNKLTEKHARCLMMLSDPAERWNTSKFVVIGKLSVRETERICKRSKKDLQERSETKREPTDVESLINKVISGLNNKDVRPFFAAISNTRFTMFSILPPFYKENGEIAKSSIVGSLKQMDSFRSNIEDFHVRVKGETAYCTLTVSYEISMTETAKFKANATIILEKEDGNWKIVHEHWSTYDRLNLRALGEISTTIC